MFERDWERLWREKCELRSNKNFGFFAGSFAWQREGRYFRNRCRIAGFAPAWELFIKLKLPSHAITPSRVLCWSVQLELYVSKRVGTFVTREVRVKEQKIGFFAGSFAWQREGGYFRNRLTCQCQTRDPKKIGWCDSYDAADGGLHFCAVSSLV